MAGVLARILTAIALVAAASACGQRDGTDVSRTPLTTVPPQPREVPLYEQFESANAEGPNGEPIDATLVGKRYPASTGMWVGCRGTATTATFRLRRNFTLLTATVGLQNRTPDGLAARVTISGDGEVLSDFTVRKTATTSVDLDVDSVDSLVVAAIREAGACGPADTPYGALGDAVLTTNLD